MWAKLRPETGSAHGADGMVTMRHTDQLVGLLVLLGVVAFMAAVFEAAFVGRWLHPVAHLRIVLPEAGVGGLASGADVQVLGIHAGTVRRIVIDPQQRMYAEADIDDQMQAFIRRDSKAVLRRQFGIAGAAFVDISRGHGTPLDWTFAVIDATVERGPTEGVGALLDQLQQRVFPILDDAGRAAHALADVAERVEHGEGDLGRLMTDDTLMHNAEAMLGDIRQASARLKQVVDQADLVAQDARGLVAKIAEPGGAPALLRRLSDVVGNLQNASKDLARAAPRLPQIAQNVEGGTANLGPLLSQTQVSLQELEKLLVQLRGLWLLGGSGPPPPEPRRLPSAEVRP